MYGRPGGDRFVGWAIDPNTAAPISVDVTVDGRADRHDCSLTGPGPTWRRSTRRPGRTTASTSSIPISEGTHKLCVIARNVGAGANTTLRCSTYTFDYGPVGKAEHLTAGLGHMNVSGWAFDKDAPTAPVTIKVTVDQTVSTS